MTHNNEPSKQAEDLSTSVLLLMKCLIPSIIGFVLFLVPLNIEGKNTIPLAYIANKVVYVLGDSVNWILLAIVVTSTVFPILFRKSVNPEEQPKWLAPLTQVSGITIVIRAIAVLFTLSVLLEVGPEWLWGEFTGGLVIKVLLVKLLSILFFASILLPLLTEYGLMDFVGTLLRKPFRLAFRLPGRAAIDSLASTFGSASVGIILSNRQYEIGHYTWREATIIATCFSTVSVPFSLVVAEILNLDHMFLSYYASAVVIIIILAFVLSRIPPLTRFEDTFFDDEDKRPPRIEEGGLMQRAVTAALQRARTGPGVTRYAMHGLRDLSNLWFNIVPPVLVFATFAMVLVEHTSLFEWLALPFVPLMEFANMENPALTAKAIVAGFADPFFPPLIGKGIESEVTRCVIAIMSVAQLIFLTETGVVLMKTKLRIQFWHLAVIFLLRTILAFPLAVLAAHWIV
jgi:nucleoside recognition membrane protein YjiH